MEDLFAYVDDVRAFLKAFKKGTMFCKRCNRFRISAEQKATDEANNESDSQGTARLLQEVFNNLEKDLKFTVEVAEDFKTNRLSTLDTQI